MFVQIIEEDVSKTLRPASINDFASNPIKLWPIFLQLYSRNFTQTGSQNSIWSFHCINCYIWKWRILFCSYYLTALKKLPTRLADITWYPKIIVVLIRMCYYGCFGNLFLSLNLFRMIYLKMNQFFSMICFLFSTFTNIHVELVIISTHLFILFKYLILALFVLS